MSVIKNQVITLQIKPNPQVLSSSPKKHRNWSLILGVCIVSLVVFIALAGPYFSPRDPMQENLIVKIGEKWYVPPFPLFSPGFPLGSDEFGRDLYSRILWATRPTLVMVTVVAAIRLVLGIIIGVLAGWLRGRAARMFDTLIDIAIAVPVLLVALGVIAAIGVETGIWAFIIGLSITGWVDTAQQVREQTRIIKGYAFIEAARSLGSQNHQILYHHILKQIAPLVVMLFAFEISGTLMTTAGLGFLGYYIGGDVWVVVGDFVARRISGKPELGQMLATSWIKLTEPWAMVAVGTIIFFTVLGLNLIGEGLRQNLDLVRVRRRGVISQVTERINSWFDQAIWHPLVQFFRQEAVHSGLIGLFIVACCTSIAFSLATLSKTSVLTPDIPFSSRSIGSTSNPTDAANLASDIQGSTAEISQAESSIQYNPEIVWEFEDTSGFPGGLVLSPLKDILYSTSNDGTLYAINLDGYVLWQFDFPTRVIGRPAVDGSGNIFVADLEGGLNKVTPDGRVSWRFQTENGDRSHSGPSIGPDGTLYYTVGTGTEGYVQSVSPNGEGKWATLANTISFYEIPIASPDAKYIFLNNNIFSQNTGERLELRSDLKIIRYFSGEDGKNYLLSGQKVIQWQQLENSINIIDVAEWDTSGLPPTVTPASAGVTEDKIAWMMFTSPGSSTELVLVTLDDKLAGITHYPRSSGQLIAYMPNNTFYICGGGPFDDRFAECALIQPGIKDPLWKINLGDHGLVNGGTWINDKLFVTTTQGKLFAIDEKMRTAASPGQNTIAQVNPSKTAELIWTYTFPEKMLGGEMPMLGEDGSLYGLTENYTLYALNPDGNLKYQISLPTKLYRIDPEATLGFIYPLVQPDGTVIIVSDKNSIYAINSNGEIEWEQTLEGKPARWPTQTTEGWFYVVDDQANLYKFGSGGIQWKYQSKAAPHTASAAVVSPDGAVYYTVTNLNKGIIQAVNPEGQGLWSVEVKTTSFYDRMSVSPDGNFVFLKDEIIDTHKAQLIQYEPPTRVDEFVIGHDGHIYLRSDHTVMQIQVKPDGLEIIQTASWDYSKMGRYTPMAEVDENQVIWLIYFNRIVWLAPDGRVLGDYHLNTDSNNISRFDLNDGQLEECKQDKEQTLSCSIFRPGVEGPVWQSEIHDISDFKPGQVFTENGYLYVLSEDQTIKKYFLGAP